MSAKEIWWALLLDGGNAEEGFFYYESFSYGPKLFETQRLATRFLASMNKPPLENRLKAKPVCVTITVKDA